VEAISGDFLQRREQAHSRAAFPRGWPSTEITVDDFPLGRKAGISVKWHYRSNFETCSKRSLTGFWKVYQPLISDPSAEILDS
jgi:hypothetical protein